ncbi:MAG: beta-ketoacyl-ACP synthase II [Candidatus Omnitrophica bacterium]|nr:beta-ketoacyl-ACP synthase II [Candidatus Omnitrophota bacterium]
MSARRRVVVTGLGCVTPLGHDPETFWTALLAGQSGVGRITAFDASGYPTQIAAEVKAFDPAAELGPKHVRHSDRFVQMAVVAAKRAAAHARLDITQEDPARVGVWIGSGMGGLATIEEGYRQLAEKGPTRISPFFIPMIICNMAPGQVSIALGAKGPNACPVSACASAGHALGDALRIIQRGEADVMIAGGSECAITQLGVGGFCALKALSTRNDAPTKASRPFDRDRDGFVIGEGAGIVVLEALDHAQRRGAPLLAEFIGYGMTGDAYHMTAPDPEGRGATACMTRALQDAGITPQDVSYINAHGTSTPLNDKVETLAIKTVFGPQASRVPISSTKSMTGHLLGAGGAVEFIACTLTIRDQVIHPTINYTTPDPDCDLDYVPNQARRAPVTVVMSNSLGFGGHNVSLVLLKFEG